jgi:hypothetical protein
MMASSLRTTLAWVAVLVTLALLGGAALVTWHFIQGPAALPLARDGGEEASEAAQATRLPTPGSQTEDLKAGDRRALDDLLRKDGR